MQTCDSQACAGAYRQATTDKHCCPAAGHSVCGSIGCLSHPFPCLPKQLVAHPCSQAPLIATETNAPAQQRCCSMRSYSMHRTLSAIEPALSESLDGQAGSCTAVHTRSSSPLPAAVTMSGQAVCVPERHILCVPPAAQQQQPVRPGSCSGIHPARLVAVSADRPGCCWLGSEGAWHAAQSAFGDRVTQLGHASKSVYSAEAWTSPDQTPAAMRSSCMENA